MLTTTASGINGYLQAEGSYSLVLGETFEALNHLSNSGEHGIE